VLTLFMLLSNDFWWTGTSITQIVIRAGELGGRHKNSTVSVIHARWSQPSGHSYAIVVRTGPRRRRPRKGAVRHLHHQLHRGAPARLFEGNRFQLAE
jgi:peptide chain release factor